MKETLLSNCERNFVNRAIEEETRLDGRDLLEARPVSIHFGTNWGSCLVSLGQTRAVAQVTCDIQQPKPSRPNEGMIRINVELNPLAALHFEGNKQSDVGILIERQLEKCLKDSKCIDLESLCIMVDKKVWNLRVDVNIINHDGNLVDCASIAALTALMHFHRPDVTSTGEEVIIHPFFEKDPLPLTLYHHPVCISFVTFESGNTVMDPTYIEERTAVAELTFAINSYREICSLHFDYLTKTMTVQDVISTVVDHAANYAARLVQSIKETVAKDVEARYKKRNNDGFRFKDCIAENKLTSMTMENIHIKLKKWNMQDNLNNETQESKETCRVVKSGNGSAELITETKVSVGEGGPNTWQTSSSSEEEDDDDHAVEITEIKEKRNIIDEIELSDSEEETTETITTKDIMR